MAAYEKSDFPNMTTDAIKKEMKRVAEGVELFKRDLAELKSQKQRWDEIHSMSGSFVTGDGVTIINGSIVGKEIKSATIINHEERFPQQARLEGLGYLILDWSSNLKDLKRELKRRGLT